MAEIRVRAPPPPDLPARACPRLGVFKLDAAPRRRGVECAGAPSHVHQVTAPRRDEEVAVTSTHSIHQGACQERRRRRRVTWTLAAPQSRTPTLLTVAHTHDIRGFGA
jgi:hypothetical protein